MKRVLSVTPLMLCVLYAFLPLFKLIGILFWYDFDLRSYPISIVFLAAVSLAALILSFIHQVSVSKAQSIFAAFLPLLATINGIIFIFVSDWLPTFVFAIICCFCSIVVLVLYVHSRALKIVFAVVSSLFLLCMLFLSFADYIFQDFGQNTTVESVMSPKYTYTAELIASDQGALGGNTYVDVVYTYRTFDFIFCEFSKRSVRLYEGGWGESEYMHLTWKDDHTLIINREEYDIHEYY